MKLVNDDVINILECYVDDIQYVGPREGFKLSVKISQNMLRLLFKSPAESGMVWKYIRIMAT